MNVINKDNVAFSAMVSKIVGVSNPGVFDIFVMKMVNENVRRSGMRISSAGWLLPSSDLRRLRRTKQEGSACIGDLHTPVLNEHTEVECVEGYLWLRLNYAGAIVERIDRLNGGSCSDT